MYSASRFLKLGYPKLVLKKNMCSSTFGKLVEHLYELPMVVQSTSVFPGEQSEAKSSIYLQAGAIVEGKSFVAVTSGIPAIVGTVCKLKSGGDTIDGLRRVQILAYRNGGERQIALVKDVDSVLLRSSYDNLTSFKRIIGVDHNLWQGENVEWHSQENHAIHSSPTTVQELISCELLCATIYKDLCISLRLYRGFKWAKIAPPPGVALSRWDDVDIILVEDPTAKAPAMSFRDTSSITTLNKRTDQFFPIQIQDEWVAVWKELWKKEDAIKPIITPFWPSIDQPLFRQFFTGFATRRALLRTYFSNVDAAARQGVKISTAERMAAQCAEKYAPFKSLMADAHLYGDQDAEKLYHDNKVFSKDPNKHRSEIRYLFIRTNAFSYAVAAQLKSLGAGIPPARLQQYLEAPTTLARLTLLAADVAHIKAQLTQEGLDKGGFTAEQLQQLEAVPICHNIDLHHKENGKIDYNLQ